MLKFQKCTQQSILSNRPITSAIELAVEFLHQPADLRPVSVPCGAAERMSQAKTSKRTPSARSLQKESCNKNRSRNE
jgi:hypothetical protein